MQKVQTLLPGQLKRHIPHIITDLDRNTGLAARRLSADGILSVGITPDMESGKTQQDQLTTLRHLAHALGEPGAGDASLEAAHSKVLNLSLSDYDRVDDDDDVDSVGGDRSGGSLGVGGAGADSRGRSNSGGRGGAHGGSAGGGVLVITGLRASTATDAVDSDNEDGYAGIDGEDAMSPVRSESTMRIVKSAQRGVANTGGVSNNTEQTAGAHGVLSSSPKSRGALPSPPRSRGALPPVPVAQDATRVCRVDATTSGVNHPTARPTC